MGLMAQRSVRFPDDVEKAVQAAADSEGRSFSNLVVRVLAERFLFEANPYSVSERPKRRAEVEALEKALGETTVSSAAEPSGSVPSASPRASKKAPSISDTWAR